MHKMSSDNLKSVLCARFLRCGGRGQATMPFDDLPLETRSRLLAEISLRADELPIVSCVLSTESWVLITTEKTLLLQPNGIVSLENNDIRQVKLDEQRNLEAGLSTLRDFRYILLETYSGTKETIEIEPGKGFLGIMNVFQNIAERNWHRRGEKGA